MYADKNEKALAFAESHMRQVRGRIKILTEKWENKTIERRGGIPTRFTGMSLEERVAARLDELRFEIDTLESNLYHTEYHWNELKHRYEDETADRTDEFWLWNCRYHREKIAEYVGDNPRSYVEE